VLPAILVNRRIAGYGGTMATHRITSVRFSRYKAFENFQLALQDFNVLVGPNNAGKSLVSGLFEVSRPQSQC
jgi:ABC-type uncharacterized transport system ATPase subunit